MKNLLIVLFIIPLTSYSQKVYSVKYSNQSDVKVYIVEYENQSCMISWHPNFEKIVHHLAEPE